MRIPPSSTAPLQNILHRPLNRTTLTLPSVHSRLRHLDFNLRKGKPPFSRLSTPSTTRYRSTSTIRASLANKRKSLPLTQTRMYESQSAFDQVDQSTPATTTMSLDDYKFPDDRLKMKMEDPSKTPLLLVACGSFSPITYLHMRMFAMASDYIKHNTQFELIGGYLSPVSDAYKKQGLAAAEHRVNMCKLAIDSHTKWLRMMVDTWEADSTEYQPTALVLDHFDHEINVVRGGVETENGQRKHVQIALLAGADLIQTMSQPGVWAEKDLDHILGQYGSFIVERAGTDIREALSSLQPYRENIYVIQQLIQNDVSSTKIRLFLKRGMSVQFLIPSPVIEYIEQNHLFVEENRASSTNPSTNGDKGKGPEASSSSS